MPLFPTLLVKPTQLYLSYFAGIGSKSNLVFQV